MWRDIALANRDALLAEIDALSRRSSIACAALVAAGDGAGARGGVRARARRAPRVGARAMRAGATAARADGPPRARARSATAHDRAEHAALRVDAPRTSTSRRSPRAAGDGRAAGLEEHLQPHAAARGAGAAARHASTGCSTPTTSTAMLDALRALGVRVDATPAHRATSSCTGAGGAFPVKRGATLFLGNAGTALRPLTAALAFAGGDYELAGVPRMHERPIGDLVDALRALGADIRYLGQRRLSAARDRPGDVARAARDRVAVRGDVSSQFLSALLMALPLLRARRGASTVDVDGELISQPYVEITLNLMRALRRRRSSSDGWRRSACPAGAGYASPGTIHVEGDASAASYFLAAGAIGGGPVRVTGVGRRLDPGRRRVRRRARAGWAPTSATATTGSRRAPGARSTAVDDRLRRDSRRGDDARDRRAVRATGRRR